MFHHDLVAQPTNFSWSSILRCPSVHHRAVRIRREAKGHLEIAAPYTILYIYIRNMKKERDIWINMFTTYNTYIYIHTHIYASWTIMSMYMMTWDFFKPTTKDVCNYSVFLADSSWGHQGAHWNHREHKKHQPLRHCGVYGMRLLCEILQLAIFLWYQPRGVATAQSTSAFDCPLSCINPISSNDEGISATHFFISFHGVKGWVLAAQRAEN